MNNPRFPSVMGAPMAPARTQIVPAPPPPLIPEGTPFGLEYLLPTNQVTIEQQVGWMEVVTGINTNNRYHILDDWGRRMYLAEEDSSTFGIICLGKYRPWHINVFDSQGQPVMQGNRESWVGACGNIVEVTTPSGQLLGSIEQNCEKFSASWNIMDSTGATVLRLESPACSLICPISTSFQAEFPLFSPYSTQKVGSIRKFWGGLGREMMTAADTFGVQFPYSLDVKLKATLVFATFMIDFMYYEDVPDNNRHHHHYPHRGFYFD